MKIRNFMKPGVFLLLLLFSFAIVFALGFSAPLNTLYITNFKIISTDLGKVCLPPGLIESLECTVCEDLSQYNKSGMLASVLEEQKMIEATLYTIAISDSQEIRNPVKNAPIVVSVFENNDLKGMHVIYTDNEGKAYFDLTQNNYNATCKEYILIYPHSKTGCRFRQCFEAVGISLPSSVHSISDIPFGKPTIKQPAADQDPPLVLPAAAHVFYCPPPPTITPSLPAFCLPLAIIFALLGGAMYLSGRNPFAPFDLSVPRMSKPIKYTARARGTSVDMMSIAHATLKVAATLKHPAKAREKEKQEVVEAAGGGFAYTFMRATGIRVGGLGKIARIKTSSVAGKKAAKPKEISEYVVRRAPIIGMAYRLIEGVKEGAKESVLGAVGGGLKAIIMSTPFALLIEDIKDLSAAFKMYRSIEEANRALNEIKGKYDEIKSDGTGTRYIVYINQSEKGEKPRIVITTIALKVIRDAAGNEYVTEVKDSIKSINMKDASTLKSLPLGVHALTKDAARTIEKYANTQRFFQAQKLSEEHKMLIELIKNNTSKEDRENIYVLKTEGGGITLEDAINAEKYDLVENYVEQLINKKRAAEGELEKESRAILDIEGLEQRWASIKTHENIGASAYQLAIAMKQIQNDENLQRWNESSLAIFNQASALINSLSVQEGVANGIQRMSPEEFKKQQQKLENATKEVEIQRYTLAAMTALYSADMNAQAQQHKKPEELKPINVSQIVLPQKAQDVMGYEFARDWYASIYFLANSGAKNNADVVKAIEQATALLKKEPARALEVGMYIKAMEAHSTCGEEFQRVFRSFQEYLNAKPEQKAAEVARLQVYDASEGSIDKIHAYAMMSYLEERRLKTIFVDYIINSPDFKKYNPNVRDKIEQYKQLVREERGATEKEIQKLMKKKEELFTDIIRSSDFKKYNPNVSAKIEQYKQLVREERGATKEAAQDLRKKREELLVDLITTTVPAQDVDKFLKNNLSQDHLTEYESMTAQHKQLFDRAAQLSALFAEAGKSPTAPPPLHPIDYVIGNVIKNREEYPDLLTPLSKQADKQVEEEIKSGKLNPKYAQERKTEIEIYSIPGFLGDSISRPWAREKYQTVIPGYPGVAAEFAEFNIYTDPSKVGGQRVRYNQATRRWE